MDTLAASPTPGKTTDVDWLAVGIRKGLTEAVTDDDTKSARETKRGKFRGAKAALVIAKWIGVNGDQVSDLLNGKKPG